MAKLKIFENNDTSADTNKPSKDGYIQVVRRLTIPVAFNDFITAEPDERVTILNEFLSGLNDNEGNPLKVWHQIKNGESRAITENNCQIHVHIDKRKVGNRPSKHTMSFPGIMPPDTGYLDRYVTAIVELYGDGSNANVKNACDFLYGIMLLTRCR
jgi:hypothetical protein